MCRSVKILVLCVFSLFCLCGLCACSNSEKNVSSNIFYNNNVQEKLDDIERTLSSSASKSQDTGEEEILNNSQESRHKKECSDCKGKGVISCLPCGGTGRVQCQQCEGKGGNCTYCDGSGNLNCATCFGKGNIDCTACGGSGKLTVEDIQGKQESSDGSTGIHPCPDCQGEGRTGICSNCDGSGWDKKTKQICVKCLSTGKNRCDRCHGYGMLDSNGNGVGTNVPPAHQTPDSPNTPPKELSKCWICHGDGKCNNCGGSGRYEFNPEWAGDLCRTCNGDGKCPSCHGKGFYD